MGTCQVGAADDFGNTDSLPPILPSGIDLPDVINAIEEKYFNNALELSNGNESKAAQLLNLTRDKFRYRRQKLAL